MVLCLDDLRAITGGSLTLAAMPPVRGAWEPLGSIKLAVGEVGAGDVLWCLAVEPCDAEHAYLRGALGVVSQRHIEPWPGRFALWVADPAAALGTLLRHVTAGSRKTFREVRELKDLQLCASGGIANFPLTCGQSAKGHAATRCQRRAA